MINYIAINHIYLDRTGWYKSEPLAGILLCVFLLPCSMTCVCVYVCLLCEQVRYKFRAKELLKSGCNELLRPDFLNAMYNTSMWSKVTIWLQALLQAPGNLIPPFSIHPN